jgi:hypothetical protein
MTMANKSSQFLHSLLLVALLVAGTRLSAQGLFVNGSGNVGIGTASPTGIFEVKGASPAIYFTDPGTSYVQFALRNSGSTLYLGQESAAGGIMLSGSSAYAGVLNMANNNPLQFGTGNVLRMTIASGGNVGIGTTNIFAPLTVNTGTTGGIHPGLVLNSAHAFGAGQGTAASALVFARNRTGDTSTLQVSAQIAGGNEDETTSNNDYMAFYTTDAAGVLQERMRMDSNGNVGIGTASPAYALDVNGEVHAVDFVSATQTYADFVFKPGYKLAPLSAVEASIKKDGHLPGIPSEEEARAHGIDLASMQVKLLQKIEELTLHQIDQQKELDALKAENAAMQARLNIVTKKNPLVPISVH